MQIVILANSWCAVVSQWSPVSDSLSHLNSSRRFSLKGNLKIGVLKCLRRQDISVAPRCQMHNTGRPASSAALLFPGLTDSLVSTVRETTRTSGVFTICSAVCDTSQRDMQRVQLSLGVLVDVVSLQYSSDKTYLTEKRPLKSMPN